MIDEIEVDHRFKKFFEETLEKFNKENYRIHCEFQYEHSNGMIKYKVSFSRLQDFFVFSSIYGTKIRQTFLHF